jgi:trimethylamine--corrinoid protein Co-methyltransferase
LIFFGPLTGEGIEAIHEATLRILGDVGIVLTQPEARALLADAGGVENGNRVRLPASLVEKAIALCPPHIQVRGRTGKAVTIGDGSLGWHNAGGIPNMVDLETGQRRLATIQDIQESTHLLDALDSVTSITPLVSPGDVPGALMALAMHRHTLSHTTKPVHGPGIQTAAEVRYLGYMAEVFGDPATGLTVGISPLSPLTLPDHEAEAIMETARFGMPLGAMPSPMLGATAPMTLAGALAQQNAEVLAIVTLAQLVHPGLPIYYCGRLATMNPRTGTAAWGYPEVGLAAAATVQIGHRYGLPVNVYGLATNASTIDAQSGYERTLNALLPALAGADELSGIGQCESGLATSLAQPVYDNEIAASVHRVRRGVAVTDETLAVDVLKNVMDQSRNFLGQRHTAEHLRAGEVLLQRFGGNEGIVRWAQAEARRILAEHEVPPLEPVQVQELDAIMEAAVREWVTL